jgi:uncharacterized protein
MFGGVELFADLSGAMYWPAERTLIVADLHLEKGSWFAERGQMLPPNDTRETLLRLAGALERSGASAVIALGDSFHDRGAWERFSAEDMDLLHRLQHRRQWTWVTGNHDATIPASMGGTVVEAVTIRDVTLRHEPSPEFAGLEIAGHLHPSARLSRRGQTVRQRCFVGTGRRIILPAFGAYAGGLNVLDAAFDPLVRGADMRVWMLGQRGVYPVAIRWLTHG